MFICSSSDQQSSLWLMVWTLSVLATRLDKVSKQVNLAPRDTRKVRDISGQLWFFFFTLFSQITLCVARKFTHSLCRQLHHVFLFLIFCFCTSSTSQHKVSLSKAEREEHPLLEKNLNFFPLTCLIFISSFLPPHLVLLTTLYVKYSTSFCPVVPQLAR